jgi:hypothetical protein
MRLGWLRAIQQAMTCVPEPTGEPRQRPLSFGIGHCPGCEHLRATNSATCTYCGSTAPVTADA